jgi:hypothetical protein
MPDDIEREDEPVLSNSLWKYMIGLCFVLALLAHPVSRVQALLNMLIRSILVLGFITLYVWPLLKDALSIVLLAVIFIFHFAVMWRLYPLVPHHGYIAIGLIALSEIAICALPIIWLDGRSKRDRTKS